jgi:hypothetical protein
MLIMREKRSDEALLGITKLYLTCRSGYMAFWFIMASYEGLAWIRHNASAAVRL